MITRAKAFAIGAALIIAVNAVVAVGVVWNRSGNPDSRVVLSHREMTRPLERFNNDENSGVSLRLRWHVDHGKLPHADDDFEFDFHGGGSPAWLDAKRLSALGFNVDRVTANRDDPEHHAAQSDREVLVVLELAGPAWQRSVEHARQQLVHRASLVRASPGAKELVDAERKVRERLESAENKSSRLFAVDVGTDLTTLRMQYPDRARYLILKGMVGIGTSYIDKRAIVAGRINDLLVSQINVPRDMRGPLEGVSPEMDGKKHRYTVVLATGRRLEPWIEAVTVP